MGPGAARGLLAAGVCAAAAVLVYLLAFHLQGGLDADDHITQGFVLVDAPAPEERAASLVEYLNTLPFSIAVLIVLAAATVTGGLRTAAGAAAIFAGANVTTQLLQAATEHPRAGEFLTVTQWPSGHATAATSLSVCVVLVTPARARPAMAALATLGLLTIGFSILLTGSHRISDVLAGILVVGAWTGLVGAALLPFAPPNAAGARAAAWAAAAAAVVALAVLAVIVLEGLPPRRYVPAVAAGAAGVAILAAAVVGAAARLPAPVRARRLTRAPTR